MKPRHRLGVALLATALAIGAVVAFTPRFRHFDPAVAVELLRGIRDQWWAIPAYIAAYCLLNIVFIPPQALSIAAPLAWGWLKGGTIELVAATIGSILPYLISRSALRGRLEPYLQRHEKIGALLETEGFSLLLLLRAVPIIPYTFLNYLAPLSKVGLVRALFATALGIIPSTFIFAYFVDALAQGLMRPRDVGIRVFGAGLLLAALIIATRLAARRLQRKLEERSRTASPPDGAGRS